MKLIVAGSRNIPGEVGWAIVYYHLSAVKDKVTEIVSGGARGIDSLGEVFANENSIPIKKFIPDWKTHGKKAGMLRNIEMAEYADAAIVIWDGNSKGSKYMISCMLKRSKPVHVITYETILHYNKKMSDMEDKPIEK